MLFKEPANMQLAKTNGLTSVKKFSSNVQTLVAGENLSQKMVKFCHSGRK